MASPHHTSSYTFITDGLRRAFHHRWHFHDGQIYECNACHSVCDDTDPYSKHWPRTRPGPPSAEQLRQLEIIDSQRIETFLLCNSNAITANGDDFLLETGIRAVPQLMHFMLYEAVGLRIKVAFYVRLTSTLERRLRQRCRQHTDTAEDLLFASSELAVWHHYDISESIDVLYTMLLQKIQSYIGHRQRVLASWPPLTVGYKVKRVQLHVKRVRQHKQQMSSETRLPLKYRLKRATANAKEVAKEAAENSKLLNISEISEFPSISQIPKTSQLRPHAPINLYCFQLCRQSHELYVVPYRLDNPKTFRSTRSFIMLDDVLGNFRDCIEITNLPRFLRRTREDRVLSCRSCGQKFMETTKYALHRMLLCGREFEILELPSDCIEIYERCLPMKCDAYKWSLFGIMK